MNQANNSTKFAQILAQHCQQQTETINRLRQQINRNGRNNIDGKKSISSAYQQYLKQIDASHRDMLKQTLQATQHSNSVGYDIHCKQGGNKLMISGYGLTHSCSYQQLLTLDSGQNSIVTADIAKLQNQALQISAVQSKIRLKNRQKQCSQLQAIFTSLTNAIDAVEQQLGQLDYSSSSINESYGNTNPSSSAYAQNKQTAVMLQQLQQTDQQIAYLLQTHDRHRHQLDQLLLDTHLQHAHNMHNIDNMDDVQLTIPKNSKNSNMLETQNHINKLQIEISRLQQSIFTSKQQLMWKQQQLSRIISQKNRIIVVPKYSDSSDNKIVQPNISNNSNQHQAGQIEQQQQSDSPNKNNQLTINQAYKQRVQREAEKRSQKQESSHELKLNKQIKAIRVLWNVIQHSSAASQIKDKAQKIVSSMGRNITDIPIMGW